MKINIERLVLEPKWGIARTAFDTTLYSGAYNTFQLTEVGGRAVRIFRHLVEPYETVDFAGYSTVSTRYEGGHPCLQDQAALQAKMDELANAPLQTTFGKPLVQPLRFTDVMTSMEHIATWRKGGQLRSNELMRLELRFRLNLPFNHTDQVRIRAALQRELALQASVFAPDEYDRYTLSVQALLSGDYANSNPWEVAEAIKPHVVANIV